MLDDLLTLGMLILLQAVLGFDNLLYISLESKRAPVSRQALVRRLGIAIAVLLRIGLLLALTRVIRYFEEPRLRNYIRISVGKPEHTDALIETLRQI